MNTDSRKTAERLALEHAIDNAALGWTLFFVGEDESVKLGELAALLRMSKSTSGDGKRFSSVFSYWGLGPTLAWKAACNNPLYWVMYKSIQEFPHRWRAAMERLPDRSYHYVSLGAGTGQKDRSILSSLLERNPQTCYFPVDMTSEMLRVAVAEVLKDPSAKRSRVLPIQIDFFDKNNMRALRQILDHLSDGKSILFSILGNTLANFEDDEELLTRVRHDLVTDQDLLLTELAWTGSTNPAHQEAARAEYKNSNAFREFATSALLQNTDVDINFEQVKFDSIEEYVEEAETVGRAIQIKVYYQNLETPKEVVILGGESFHFDAGDTIRLYLSRKYSTQGLDTMIQAAGFRAIHQDRSEYDSTDRLGRFGLVTALLA